MNSRFRSRRFVVFWSSRFRVLFRGSHSTLPFAHQRCKTVSRLPRRGVYMSNASTRLPGTGGRRIHAKEDSDQRINRSSGHPPSSFSSIIAWKIPARGSNAFILFFCFSHCRCRRGRAGRQMHCHRAQMSQILFQNRFVHIQGLRETARFAQRLVPAFALPAQIRAATGFFAGRVRLDMLVGQTHDADKFALAAHRSTRNASPLRNMLASHRLFKFTLVARSLQSLRPWQNLPPRRSHRSP